MKDVFIAGLVVALIGTVVSLFYGLLSMGKTGKKNSTTWMWRRVIFQLFAVIILAILFSFYR